MQIDIPQEQYDKLTDLANAAGYADVVAFMVALAAESAQDPRGPLGEQELRESVARLKQADASIDAGEGIEAEEAFRRVAEKYAMQIKS